MYAWGEHFSGTTKQSKDFLCMTIVTGIATAVMSNGHLIHGSHFTSGELGHITVMTIKDSNAEENNRLMNAQQYIEP